MASHSLAQAQNQDVPVNVLFVNCVANYKGLRPRVKHLFCYSRPGTAAIT